MSTENFDLPASSELALIPKILVVEPDPALSEMLCTLFFETGYDCKIVNSCTDIIPLLESYGPDLVLVEYLLTNVNGGELCMQVKSDARYISIPVILYSAYPQLLWSVEDYGCDAFLAKPFDVDELCLTIDRLLVKGKEARRFSLLADTLKNRLNYLGRFLGGIAKVA